MAVMIKNISAPLAECQLYVHLSWLLVDVAKATMIFLNYITLCNVSIT